MKSIYLVLALALFGCPLMAQDNIAHLSDGKRYISFFFAYGDEQKRKPGIDKTALRFNYEEYHNHGFSVGGDLIVKNYQGQRDGLDANTFAVGISYLLKWHFVRERRFTAYFEHGAGPVLSDEGFPPKGTTVNGMSNVGLGVMYLFSEKSYLAVGVRDYHSSNGRGFVERNPAYDATIYYIGTTINIK